MNIDNLINDDAILEEIGHRLNRRRIELGLTQAELAEESGVSKRTVERVEAGASTQSATLIRILRILKWLNALDAAIPQSGPRPMDLLHLKGKERQRASSKKRQTLPGEAWSWDDET